MAVTPVGEQVQLHDLKAPADMEPTVIRMSGRPLGLAMEPGGAWIAVQDNRTLSLWPLSWRHPQVLQQGAKLVRSVAIDPGSRWIASGGVEATTVSLWPVSEGTVTGRTILDVGEIPIQIEASPRGDLLAVGTRTGMWIRPLEGRPERLPGFNSMVNAVAFDRSGRWLAAGGGMLGQLNAPGENVVRVWDLETRAVRVLAAADGAPIGSLAFLPDGRLLAAGPAGVRVWDLNNDTSTLLLPDVVAKVLPSPDGRRLLLFRAPLRPGGAVGLQLSTTSRRSNRRRLSLTAIR
jgi:WD40 repeat protein